MKVQTMPDAEALIVAFLSTYHTQASDVTIWTTDTQTAWPYIADQVAVQVDVRGKGKAALWDITSRMRRDLIHWQFQHGCPFHAVEPVTGPMWLPDPDGTPRYLFQVQVTTREERRTR